MAPLEWGSEVYTAEVTGDVLQCRSQTGAQGNISLSDILGVHPVAESFDRYTILFILKPDGESDEAVGSLAKAEISSLPPSLSDFLVQIPDYLKHSEPIQIVVSVLSGTQKARAVCRDIVEPFLTHLSLKYEVHETKSAQTIKELSESKFLVRACSAIPQTIILLSGDGGLVDLVDVFYESNRPVQTPPQIALIPCGTGNAMASSIGLRSGTASALLALLQGTPTPLPVCAVKLSPGSQLVTDEGRKRTPLCADSDTPHRTLYGAVVVSWALHAALVADSDTAEYRKFGLDRFKMAANALLYPTDGTESHRFQGKITYSTAKTLAEDSLPETTETDEHMYAIVSMVPRLEKDFLISPNSKPLGGEMWLTRWGPMSAEEAIRLTVLAYQGGLHVHEKPVTHVSVERLRIDFHEDLERWRRVCIDGNIIAAEKGGWMELQKESRQLLQVIKPRGG